MNKKVYVVGDSLQKASYVMDKFRKEFRDYILFQDESEIFVHGANIKAISCEQAKKKRRTKYSVYIKEEDFIAICYKIKCKKLEDLIKAIGGSNG